MHETHRVRELLAAEERLLTRLFSFLEGEKRAVIARDLASLDEAVSGKNGTIVELEEATRARLRALDELGVPSGKEGFENWIAGLDEPVKGAVLSNWNNIVRLLQECHEQNLLNGLLIDTSQRQTLHLLAFLYGQVPDAGLYDNKGSATGSAGSRTSIRV